MIPAPPNKVTEIEIFTEDQLMILPDDARDSIISLEANLPKKELLVLTPLVVKLLKIKELAKLKYIALPENPTKEQIALQKENVQQFDDAKKEIAALKKQNGEAKKAIKGPLDDLGKEVLIIERSINSIIVETLEALENTFKPYLDEKAEKARIAKEKKEKAATEAINKLTEENQAQADTFKKSQLITFLKYEMLGQTKLEVQNAIDNYALDKLFKLRDSLPLKTFEHFTKSQEMTLLTDDEIEGIKTFFTNEFDLFRKNINTKITALELIKTNEKLSDTVEQQTEEIAKSAILPPPPAPPTSLIANTDVFEVLSNNNGNPYGAGANNVTVPVQAPLYPKNSNEVDFLDLVISQILTCKDNIDYIRKRFADDEAIVKTDRDLHNIEKVEGAATLLDRTIAYILAVAPHKPNAVQGPPAPPLT